MAGDWYTPSGAPATSSQGSSATMRSEFDSVETAMDKLPTLTGNGDKLVKVNSGGTALETTAQIGVAQGGTGAATLTDGGVLLGSGTGAITAMAVLADGEMIVGDGTTDPVAESGATLRTSIGVAIGTNVQAYDAGLTSLAALATAADKIPYTTAADTYAEADFTAAGRALLDDANAAAQRTTLGLGDAATKTVGKDSANIPDNADLVSVTAAGTDTYTATYGITALITGYDYKITVTNANTSTTPTLNLDSLGAKTIKKDGGDALAAGDIPAGHEAVFRYDGTDMMLLNPKAQTTVIFSESFTSSAQTITAAGALALAHGLSSTPTLIQLRIKCTSAEHNYSIDDEVVVNPAVNTMVTGADGAVMVLPDATNVNIRFGSAASAFVIANKTTGAGSTIVNASWKLIVRAWA
jgi:hypothetical protein